jgi:hypothetical protein
MARWRPSQAGFFGRQGADDAKATKPGLAALGRDAAKVLISNN